jgi:acetyl-CoA acetyltransferase family protein
MDRTLTDALIVAAIRTPIGRLGAALSGVRPDDLAAHALREAVARAGVDGADLEDVVLGCANQAGEDCRDVGRMAALLADLPEHVGGTTVNRLCGSGLDAVAAASRMLRLGEGELYAAGGVESMSRAPWAVPKPGRGFQTGPQTMHDTSLGWRFVNPEMERRGHTDSMGQTAENLAADRWAAPGQADDAEAAARRYDLSREAQDRFALASHRKAVAAAEGGRFADEIAPVTVRERREERVVASDEGPRRDASLERLAGLRPAFAADGTVTAGNSSSLNDGAAVVLLASPRYAREHGLRPLARIRSVATAGVPPRVMGIGPVPATAKALQRAGITLADVGLIELNEAFAAQALAVLHEWGIEPDDARLNPNGGAIALGHPLGCSGARILTTLVHEMQRRPDVRYGLATMCVGVGQGIAMVVERADTTNGGPR